MLAYQNLQGKSPIKTVEFPEDSGDKNAFLHLKSFDDLEPVKAWLGKVGLSISAQALVGDQPVLVVTGGMDQKGMLEALKARGDEFKPVPPKKKSLKDPWVWRGITSFAGQSLTLYGSLKNPNTTPSDRWGLAGFATANIVANVSNIVFGQQKKKDPHQLRTLKEQINERLAERFSGELPVFSPDENRSGLRQEEDTRSTGRKIYDIAQKYSVSGGEIGLRIFGATNLSYPIKNWAKAPTSVKDWAKGGALLSDPLDGIRNDNDVTYKAGLITLLGKFVSLASKEPDPFNPKPPSLIDKMREKATFRLSSVIEGVAAAWMAKDRFSRGDWAGGAGNLIFVGGYMIRLLAPFGERAVDMKELNAHITDSIAGMPREQLPQTLADIASDLHRHFNKGKAPGKGPSIGQLYADLATDLKKYHGIDLSPDGIRMGTSQQMVQVVSNEAEVSAPESEKDTPGEQRRFTDSVRPAAEERKSFAHEGLKRPARAAEAPAETHLENVSRPQTAMARGA